MRIVIVGAGLSGLTLAAALHAISPDTELEIYERDDSWPARPQGYSIGLKGDGGIPVLRALGVFDRLAADAIEISDLVFVDQRGKQLMALRGRDDEEIKDTTRRVRRTALRAALRTVAPEIPIRYGAVAAGYRQEGERVWLRLAGGEEVEADWLIAADGASSALRGQWIGDEPHTFGLRAIVGDTEAPVAHPLLDGGYFMTLADDGSSGFCYRQPAGVHLSMTLHDSEPSNDLAVLTKGWHSPIPEIVAAIDPSSLVVREYSDRDPLTKVRDGRVWLIGDAAHPMVPFQGQGANTGMRDAFDLAAWLSGTSPADPEPLIVARGRKAVLGSRRAAEQFHTTSGFSRSMRNLGFRSADVFMALGRRFARH